MIAEDAAKIVRTEILPDEQLFWADKPRSVSTLLFYFIAFLLLFFVGFFIGPMGYALSTGDMTIFDGYSFSINGKRVTSETPVAFLWPAFLAIIIMMIIFISAVIAYFLIKMREVYGITNRRALIISRFPTRRVSSVNPAMTPYIERSGNQKIGSISFRGAEHGIVDKILALYRVRLQEFTKIRNPMQVEALIYERFIDATKKEG